MQFLKLSASPIISVFSSTGIRGKYKGHRRIYKDKPRIVNEETRKRITESPERVNTKARYVRTQSHNAEGVLPARNMANPAVLNFDLDHSRLSKKFFQIQLVKSLISMPKAVRRMARMLGVEKRGRTIYKPITPMYAGLCFRLRNLIGLRIVDEIPKKFVTNPGYFVMGQYIHPWILKSRESFAGKGPFLE